MRSVFIVIAVSRLGLSGLWGEEVSGSVISISGLCSSFGKGSGDRRRPIPCGGSVPSPCGCGEIGRRADGMRRLVSKYPGECRKCGADLAVGCEVMYQRRVGVFCPGCEPTNPEEIRAYLVERAERKANRLEEWAGKREAKAGAQLNSHSEIRHDWAFITQPGHIPFRARMIAADDRAFESLRKAASMRGKAASLRHVVVAGDRERAREAQREAVRAWVEKGMRVSTSIYGNGVVLRVNRKTATIGETGQSGTFKVVVDLSWLSKVGE
jgi:hypothetical protein